LTDVIKDAAGVTVNGILDLSGGFETIGSLAGTNTAALVTIGKNVAANGSLTVGDGTSTSFAGVIQDGAAGAGITTFTKQGAGTLTLTNINTYTGTTVISGGKLTIASGGTINGATISIGAGELNYNSSTALSKAITFTGTGGKLSGTGTITPAVTVSSNNTLAPGNSIGTLSFGTGLTIAGTYSAELGTPNASAASGVSDRAVVTGALNLSGGTLTLVDNAAANGNGSAGAGSYRLITNTGVRTGTFATVNPVSATLHEKVLYGASTVDLNLYRLATANTITTPVNLGNVRVGGSLSQTVTVTNTAANDTFSEGLDATTGTLTGSATASGSVTNLPAGTSSTSITVGVSTGTAGAKTGTVPINLASNGLTTSLYGTTALTGQTVTVSGAVYNPATAATSQTVTLPNTRVGAAASASVTLTNTAPVNATYTETLGTTGFTGTTSGYTATGSATGIVGGASGSGTLSVGVSSPGSAGTFSGSTTLGLQTQAVNGSGLGTLAITSQVVTINGAAYDFASPTLNTVGPVDFGTVHMGAASPTGSVSISNSTITNATYQDSLNASATTNNASVTGNSFAAQAAGTTGSLTLTASTATAGSLASTATLAYVSNANGVSGLSNTTLASGTISTTGAVYSGLSTWATNGSGSWGTLASGFGANWGATQGSPGLDAGFTITDTATFSNALTSGTATVALDGASPSLKAVTFNNTNSASYTLAAGSGGAVTLNGGGSGATLTDSNGSHAVSAPVTLADNLTATVTNLADTLTVSGVISETGGAKTLTKGGAGGLTLTGDNTFTGATTINAGTLTAAAASGKALGTTSGVTINGGTLLLGANDQIGAGATVTLAGGTLNTGGFSQTTALSSLTLSSTSTLDFGAGNSSTVNFGDSSLAIWGTLGSTYLNILNYNGLADEYGSSVGSAGDALFIGSSGAVITDDQLAEIRFVNPEGYDGVWGATRGLNGQILVAVPEPTTILAGLGLLGLVGYRERRRISTLIRG
jgi:autotransporter-associated beta strand protein